MLHEKIANIINVKQIWEPWAIYMNVPITSFQATISICNWGPRVPSLFCSFCSLFFLCFPSFSLFLVYILLYSVLFLGNNSVYNNGLKSWLGVLLYLRPMARESYGTIAFPLYPLYVRHKMYVLLFFFLSSVLGLIKMIERKKNFFLTDPRINMRIWVPKHTHTPTATAIFVWYIPVHSSLPLLHCNLFNWSHAAL